MRDRPEQVSGFKLDVSQEEADDDDALAKMDVHGRFVSALEREVPEILVRAQERMRHRPKGQVDACSRSAQNGLWSSLKIQRPRESAEDKPAAAFSFGFGDRDLEMEDVPW